MIDVAISPCPNDTFLFDGWINGKIDAPRPAVRYLDIQELNRLALTRKPSLVKVSCSTFGKIKDDYDLLPIGAAIGPFGPKLVAKKEHPKTIAIPGFDTTACFLLEQLYNKPKKLIECRYDQIVDLVLQDKVDAGLIIHESRFTFASNGLIELCDFGDLFFQRYHLPVPLGVVALKKGIDSTPIVHAMRLSLEYAYKAQNFDFVLAMSQEKSLDIVKQHIATYVTDETKNISQMGLQAIETLLTLAR